MKQRTIILLLAIILASIQVGLCEEVKDGKIAISCEMEVFVFVDSVYAGVTDAASKGIAIENLPAGIHKIKLLKPGYESVEMDVTAATGKMAELNAPQFSNRSEKIIVDVLGEIVTKNFGYVETEGCIRIDGLLFTWYRLRRYADAVYQNAPPGTIVWQRENKKCTIPVLFRVEPGTISDNVLRAMTYFDAFSSLSFCRSDREGVQFTMSVFRQQNNSPPADIELDEFEEQEPEPKTAQLLRLGLSIKNFELMLEINGKETIPLEKAEPRLKELVAEQINTTNTVVSFDNTLNFDVVLEFLALLKKLKFANLYFDNHAAHASVSVYGLPIKVLGERVEKLVRGKTEDCYIRVDGVLSTWLEYCDFLVAHAKTSPKSPGPKGSTLIDTMLAFAITPDTLCVHFQIAMYYAMDIGYWKMQIVYEKMKLARYICQPKFINKDFDYADLKKGSRGDDTILRIAKSRKDALKWTINEGNELGSVELASKLKNMREEQANGRGIAHFLAVLHLSPIRNLDDLISIIDILLDAEIFYLLIMPPSISKSEWPQPPLKNIKLPDKVE